jgi:hypothetical protein
MKRVSLTLAYGQTLQAVAQTLVLQVLAVTMLYYSAYLIVVQHQLTISLMIGFLLYIGYMVDATNSMTLVYTTVKYVTPRFSTVF